MPKVKMFNPETALDKAATLFWQKGYFATSMEDLVKGMEISRQSLYDTFGNKQQLFDLCIEDYQQKAILMNCEIINQNKTTVELFNCYFDFIIDGIIADTDNKNCFLINTIIETKPENSKSQLTIEKNLAALQELFKSKIQEGMQHNHFKSNFTAEEIANHLITSIHGIKVMGKVNKNRTFLQGLAKTALSILN